MDIENVTPCNSHVHQLKSAHLNLNKIRAIVFAGLEAITSTTINLVIQNKSKNHKIKHIAQTKEKERAKTLSYIVLENS